MTTFYVATLSRYVLIQAANEAAARELGRVQLQKLYGHNDFSIRLIRPATDDEIEFGRWHEQMTAKPS